MDPVVPSAAGARGAAADVADAEAAETERSFSDLPELALHAIGAACYPDAKQLLRLSLACRAARGLDCEAIWRDWVKRRFGDAALPPEPPAGAAEGCGVRGGGGEGRAPEGREPCMRCSPAELVGPL